MRHRRSAPALLTSGGASPLRYNWQTGKPASGPPTLDARAVDAAGAGASVRVTVTKPQQGMPRHDGHIGATWEADYRIGSSAPM